MDDLLFTSLLKEFQALPVNFRISEIPIRDVAVLIKQERFLKVSIGSVCRVVQGSVREHMGSV